MHSGILELGLLSGFDVTKMCTKRKGYYSTLSQNICSIHQAKIFHQEMLKCYRELVDKSPFIPKDLVLSISVEKVGDESYKGVNFANTVENISPHISQTHCECALHVYCREVASSLSDTLAAKDELTRSLPALHIKVAPVAAAGLIASTSTSDGVHKAHFGTDSYSILSGKEVTTDTFATDRIITLSAVQAAVGQHSESNFKVLLIDLIGEEEVMGNWAFLTNEAMSYIINDLGVEVVVVNTASVDRESDGGFVPNHKIIFENRHHLVIELAQLSHLEHGQLGIVLLNIEPHNTYADCGSSKLEFQPSTNSA